jgi:multiple sugar transport system substrate-binding protein
MDEINYAFIIPDMMAKAATGALSAEASVKWAAQRCEAIMKKWQRKG